MKTRYLIFSIMLIVVYSGLIYGQNSINAESLTAGQVIAEIIKHTGNSAVPNTVDVIKEGDPQTTVTGIITCMFATMNVLKQAVDKSCNLVIVHEPLYYNHLDETDRFQNDPVFLEKRRFISDHKLVIWRFHDNIHMMRPDGIETGMVTRLGWKDYEVKGSTSQFVLPVTTLKELVKYLKQIFPKNAFYVVGNPEMKLSNVRLAVGAPGSARHIMLLEDKNVDVVIAGEAQQWETYEYMRDAVDQGRNKAIVFLGHINSEEAGMDYCSLWLKSFIKSVPVFFVESGSSFWSY
jgi:putative NIF3 family GTP cyclohydrolase 1 type 2